MKKITIIIIFFNLSIAFGFAQKMYMYEKEYVSQKAIDNNLIDSVCQTVLNDLEISNLTLQNNYQNKDQLGITHVHYKQIHNNIQISGSDLFLHLVPKNNGFTIRAEGLLFDSLDTKIGANIVNQNKAINTFLETIKDSLVNQTEEKTTAKLVIDRLTNQSYTAENLQAYYIVQAKTENQVFKGKINAQTGKFAQMINNRFHDSKSKGEANTLYNGTQYFETTYSNWFTVFRLIDETRGQGIYTKKSYWFGTDAYYNDANNIWNDNHNKRTHASAHWASQVAWDYFYNQNTEELKNTLDNFSLTVFPIYELGEPNCKSGFNHGDYDGVIQLGEAIENECNDLVTLDLVGHEFTHFVCYYEANMSPNTITDSGEEAYALMEGVCDIFGEMIEAEIKEPNWKHGFGEEMDAYLLPQNQRVFSPPIVDGFQSMEYEDTNWQTYTNGHYRGGVLMHWFYLLSEGGSYNNINVEKIGRDKASDLIFRTLTEYLFTHSDFQSTKYGTLWAAEDLEFSCYETEQVLKAWEAVNVKSKIAYDLNMDCDEINSYPGNYIAFNNLESDCRIVNNSPDLVHFIAGNKIVLKDGFRSGKTFRATIENCPQVSSKRSVRNYKSETSSNKNHTHHSCCSNSLHKTEKAQNVPSVHNLICSPNPFTSSLKISYTLPEATHCQIEIYNIYGQLQTTLVNQNQQAGTHHTYANFSGLPVGVYMCRLTTASGTTTQKVVKQ